MSEQKKKGIKVCGEGAAIKAGIMPRFLKTRKGKGGAEMMDPIITLHYGCVETMIEEETLKAVMKVGIEVDKERLLKALKDARSYYDEGYEAGKKDAVVHGHWEMISHSEVEPVADYACSVCSGLLIDVIDDDRHELNAYCPMCGAKMDAERKEGDRNAAD